ncbi:MAG: hypothetical protein ACRC8S_09760 [Fimbriiglobus sp.]
MRHRIHDSSARYDNTMSEARPTESLLAQLRRFVVIYAFLLWQGGFVFYGAVVVPIGSDVLGSDRPQGFITQRVTVWLNFFGLVWCAALTWDCLSHRDRWRGWLVLVSLVLQLALFAIHWEMTTYLDFDTETVTSRLTFRRWHQVYLTISTAHWLMAIVVLWRTLRLWRAA